MIAMLPPGSQPQDTPQDRFFEPAPQQHPGVPAPGQGGSYGVDLNAEHPREKALWELAVKRLKAKQEFRTHAVAYALVNTFLVALWWITSEDAIFWPAFPILGWGIGLGMHAWSVFGPSVATQEQIEREMERLRRQS